ncbi:LacI family DNA-binding transcriptional regulator [Weissella paramesenteroides]|jgi:LacI family transcriptional regulator|uniref:LacI family DNA-binding transcriptional regulator n=1 Tax=Weissella paramesenteroides TaxID=1249 RepID=UPI0023F696C0|nr:LacI family DNA-binding transcriptional regulator [Weissella paramesenteroides]MDF8373889.1 substrate-binding domain-containing protein [Weissella paramesenteroides]WIG65524.1 substrate-binding domain-containing protein [Weissella paramesenteroides]
MNINDVAKRAGVSRGSVSNYLNNRRVSDGIKGKIEQAIAELNYVPNTAARDLRKRASNFVVFIIPTVRTPFFAELTYYVQMYLTQKDYKMILCISDSNFEREKDYLEMAEGQKVAGIISISYSQMNLYVKPTIPLVSIEKEPTGFFPLVSSDNYQGGQLAAEKLQEFNPEKIILIGLENPDTAMLARQSGFIDKCRQVGILPTEFLLNSTTHNSEKTYKKLINFCRELKKEKIGIFAITDEYAFLVYRILSNMGIQIPEQVQIIGFDGSNEHKEGNQLLSSIRQPVEQLASIAVDQLEQSIAADGQHKNVARIYLPVKFQQGDTTPKIEN